MSSKIKFQDPPRSKTGSDATARHEDIAAQLKDRPGEWALILENVSPSAAGNIRRGMTRAYRPAGSFETAARKSAGGKADIWARYVGEV